MLKTDCENYIFKSMAKYEATQNARHFFFYHIVGLCLFFLYTHL